MNLLVRATCRLQLVYSIYEFKAFNYRIYSNMHPASNKRPAPPRPISPPNRKKIDYVLIRDFPEDGVFLRGFYRNPALLHLLVLLLPFIVLLQNKHTTLFEIVKI